jgi:Ca2+-binding EF-hand superfamily protein
MKNRMTAVLFSIAFAVSSAAGMNVSAESQETGYVKEQVIDYTSTLGTETKILVSSNEDETELLLQFDFYDDDAEVKVSRNEMGEYEVTEGAFFATDGRLAAEQAVEEGSWKRM